MWAAIKLALKEGWFWPGVFFFVVGILSLVIASLLQTSQPVVSSVLTAIGTIFALSVAVHFFDQAYQRHKKREELRKDIQYGLAAIEHQRDIGLHQVVPEMPFEDLFDRLTGGDTLYWLDTYNAKFNLWIRNLEGALKRGANVRMLMIHPDAANLVHRLAEIRDIGIDLASAQEVIKSLERALKELQKRFPQNLQFKFYSSLPTMPAYVIERDGIPTIAYSSLFLARQKQIEFPHFVWTSAQDVDRPETFLTYIHTHLKNKWEQPDNDEAVSVKPIPSLN